MFLETLSCHIGLSASGCITSERSREHFFLRHKSLKGHFLRLLPIRHNLNKEILSSAILNLILVIYLDITFPKHIFILEIYSPSCCLG